MSLVFYFGIAVLIQIIMFIPAYIFKTDKLTDLSYGLTFIALSAAAFLSSGMDIAKIMLFVMILAWALRIAVYLFIRIKKTGKDKRFDGIRENFMRFLEFWLLQGIAVWVILIPSLLYFSGDSLLGISTVIGMIIWLIGLATEGIADLQKYSFNSNPKNKGRWIESGLWKYSRHPNYFGEILCWLGIYIFTINAFSLTQKLIALISPLFIALLLIFVSGIPKLEKSAEMKWGDNKNYQRYKKSTSVLVILPKKR